MPETRGALTAYAPALIVLGAAWAWRDWHVDDAAITYAYARDLADGLGFRPFAASEPVEGFSNPSWTLLLAATARLGVPVWAASKGWQLALAALAVAGCGAAALRTRATPREAALSGAIAAVTVPFALWSQSGLETSLVAALLVAGVAVARGGSAPAAGLVAGLLAVSRPEGPLLAAGVLAAWGWERPRGEVAVAVVLAATLPLGWLGLRLAVFHAWWPNTAPARLEPDWGRRAAKGGWYLIQGGLVAGGLLAPGLRGRAVAIPAALAVALVLMGGDWMRHARLLAPAVPAVCALAVPVLARVGWGRALLVAHVAVQVATFGRAYTAPPLPEAVVARIGAALEDAAAHAWKEPLTVATPDVGGILHGHPDRTVVDFAGLVDRDAAVHGREVGYWPRRLARDAPRFVVLHTLWAARTGLDEATLHALGYVRVCSQHKPVGAAVHTLDLYARGALPPKPLERLRTWCAGPP